MTEQAIKNTVKKEKKIGMNKRNENLSIFKSLYSKRYSDYDSNNAIATAYGLMFLDFNDDDDDDD